MRRNVLRELLKSGKASLGTHIASPWPTTIEIIGRSGVFDYVEFMSEYSAYSLHDLDNLHRAVELFPEMTSMVKLEQEPRTYLTMKYMSAGFQNVLFADVRTAADAEECVRAVRAESPASGGRRGAGMGRDVGILFEGASPAFVEASKEAVVAIMIEKKEAVENLEAILSVPGIDMINFGASDYSMSVGLAGQRDHPSIKEAEEYAIKTALKMGVVPRAEATEPAEMEHYLAMGVKHFCVGWDLYTLYCWCRDNGGAMRELLSP